MGNQIDDIAAALMLLFRNRNSTVIAMALIKALPTAQARTVGHMLCNYTDDLQRRSRAGQPPQILADPPNVFTEDE